MIIQNVTFRPREFTPLPCLGVENASPSVAASAPAACFDIILVPLEYFGYTRLAFLKAAPGEWNSAAKGFSGCSAAAL